jgi:hypothetical protein
MDNLCTGLLDKRHAVWTWTSSVDMGMQLGHEHAAWACKGWGDQSVDRFLPADLPRSSNGINERREKVGEASVTKDHVCHYIIGQKLRVGQHLPRFVRTWGHGVSKSLGFLIKNLLDDNRDLTPWPRGIRRDWSGLSPPSLCSRKLWLKILSKA